MPTKHVRCDHAHLTSTRFWAICVSENPAHSRSHHNSVECERTDIFLVRHVLRVLNVLSAEVPSYILLYVLKEKKHNHTQGSLDEINIYYKNTTNCV